MTEISSLTHVIVEPRSGSAPHPLLLLLHGRGADEYDLLPLVGELDPRLLTVSVRAPHRVPGSGYMWYALDERGVGFPDRESIVPSMDQLLALVRQIIAERPGEIDPTRVYTAGFSMGAVMAASLALTAPAEVAGAAILSGYVPTGSDLSIEPEALTGHPFFVAHGTLDPMIPVVWGRKSRETLAQFPVELEYHEYREGHEIGSDELTDLAAWFTRVLGSPAARPNQASAG